MNLQEVNNISITEGTVRTIHDSNGKLLWGKLTYSTTYDGDTEQDGTPTPSSPVDIDVVTGTQTVTVRGKNMLDNNSISLGKNWNGAVGTTCYPYEDRTTRAVVLIPVKPSTTYTVRLYESEWYSMGMLEADNSYEVIRSIANTVGNDLTITVTTESNAVYFGIKFKYGTAGTTDIVQSLLSELKIQLEENSTATDYEPYQSGSFTVNLGTTELCKIDTYQDYIYKSGDDWYIHKEISNTTFTGDVTESWDLYISGQVFRIRILDMQGEDNQNVIAPLYCYYYEPDTYSHLTASSGTKPDYGIAGRASVTSGIAIRNKDCEDVTSFKTWLSTHNTTVYYALATPTDTQITDATLITQLDSIHQFLTRYGYTGTVSGSLPLVINQTTLS